VLGRQVYTENGWLVGYVHSIYTAQDGKVYVLVRSSVIQGSIPMDLVKAIGDVIIVSNSIYPRDSMPLTPGVTVRKHAYTISGKSLGIVYDEYNYENVTYLRIIGPTGYVAIPVDKVYAVGDVVIINQVDVQPIPLSQAYAYQAQQTPAPVPQPIQPIQPTPVNVSEQSPLDKIANYYLYGFFIGIVALIAFVTASLVLTVPTKTAGNIPLIYILNVIPIIIIAVASIGLAGYSYMIKQSIMRREFRYALRDSVVLMAALATMAVFTATFFIPALSTLWLMVGGINLLYASPPVLVTIIIYAIMIVIIYIGYMNLRSYTAKFKAGLRSL
jgi:sporulation protein YlmC with PRC-barrel domain/uncharacterized membrane protein YidH (DUF202 family)